MRNEVFRRQFATNTLLDKVMIELLESWKEFKTLEGVLEIIPSKVVMTKKDLLIVIKKETLRNKIKFLSEILTTD